jgi:hypothetical protein
MDETPRAPDAIVLAITEVKPRTIDRALALFESALEAHPAQSRCAGVWRTDAGALNQIISLWTAPRQADAIRTSAEVLSTLNDIREGGRLLKLTAAPFSPPLLPRRLGGIYEFRFYTFRPKSFAGIVNRWSGAIGQRLEFSPLLGVWCEEGASADELVHAWAFEDANAWQSVRREVMARGVWPPLATADSSGALLRQTSVIALPASFSPIR